MTQALHSTHPAEMPLLQVKDLVREYTLPRDHLFKPPGKVHALNGVNFSIASAAASASSANRARASPPWHGW